MLMGRMIYFTYLNGMRQLLGCSICFYAMEYAYKRRPLPFFLLVFLASGFHQICVLFSIAYFLNWIKFDLKKALVAIAGTYVLSQTIFKFVINILADTSYGNYMLNAIDDLVTFIFNKNEIYDRAQKDRNKYGEGSNIEIDTFVYRFTPFGVEFRNICLDKMEQG